MGKCYCCMSGCHNVNGKIGKFGKSVSVHKLLSNKPTRIAWIQAIRRKDWASTNYTRVCLDHFTDGLRPNVLNRLKVPTENLAQKTKLPPHQQEYANKDNDDTVTDIKLPPNYQSVGIDTKKIV
ncbi:hypothetical protein ACF0H5_006252 [Mactra antiquata]